MRIKTVVGRVSISFDDVIWGVVKMGILLIAVFFFILLEFTSSGEYLPFFSRWLADSSFYILTTNYRIFVSTFQIVSSIDLTGNVDFSR